MNKQKKWTDKEIDTVKKMYDKGSPYVDISEATGRSIKALEGLIYRKGFKRIIVKAPKPKKETNLVDADEFSKSLLKGLSGKPSIKAPKLKPIATGKITESAVLLLSDIHSGQVNKYLNPNTLKKDTTYNTEMMLEESNVLLNSIAKLTKLLSPSYNFERLYIFGLGDLVENDVIYKGQRLFIDKAVGQQLLNLVQMLADMCTELLKIFPEIEFHFVPGNHGRLSAKREAAPSSSNFDMLAGEMLKLMFRDNDRINIVVADSWTTFVNIYGWKYFLHHGNSVRSWMGLPYYGVVRQSRSRRVEVKFQVECMGHFHQSMKIPMGHDSITVVNGSWIDCCEYVWQEYGQYSKAQQTFFGVSSKRPITWNFEIDLYKEPHVN